MNYPLDKPDSKWREELTEFEYHVLREAGGDKKARHVAGLAGRLQAVEQAGRGHVLRRHEEETRAQRTTSRAFTPGSGFPSSHSRKAPPAVEI